MNLVKNYCSRTLSIVLLAFILINSASCTNAPAKNLKIATKADKIQELVGLYSDYEGFNGAILVAQEGKIIYKKGYGLANMEWDIPNQVDTKFQLASVTKPFTALLIMKLVSEKKLDLNKPISTYLPDYPKEQADKITIHQLLTHSAGIARDYKSDDKLNKYPDRYRLKELVAKFSGLPLEFDPGEQFEYSNSGYLVLGYIIEQVMGKPFETVLEEQILTPLQMKNTGVDKHRPIIKNRAKGYFKGFGDYNNSDYIDMSTITAVGNMYATVEDLFLLDQALYNETLFPKKYLDLIFTNHIPDPSYGGHYGYGWELKEKSIGNTGKNIATIGHSGSINGFCALFTRIPSSKSTIILLNNTRRAYLNAITTGVIGILNEKPYDYPKKPLALFMTRIIDKEGIDKGVAYYKIHKDDGAYYKDENELIVAGYRFLQAENAIDAAKIFKLAIAVYPKSYNPYDSYAEAMMKLKRDAEAIKYYKKSLEINPNNNNGKEMLKKLEK